MTCILLNHNYINEVQTVTQLFFPGNSFTSVNKRPNQYSPGYVIETYVDEKTASAKVIKDGVAVAEHVLSVDALPLHLSPRRVLMLAMYHALQSAVGAYTPWGALTGIRPSKMVREWLDCGYSHEKIRALMADPFCCTPDKARLALEVAEAEIKINSIIAAAPVISAAPVIATAPVIAGLTRNLQTPIGIYISIPFCPTRCVYCSFNVDHKPAAKNIEEQYIAKLIQECTAQAQRLRELGGTLSSIYIGGGTPTALPENLLEQLLDAVAVSFNPQPGLEFSVEAGRPDTFTKSKLALLRRYGVNRIAVNPQTLNDNTLAIIGRKHTAADFFRAFDMARDAGFECINTDIIAGLPGETPCDMRRTMEGIAALSPENITVHTLAVKRASRLNATLASYALPDAKTTETMLGIASDICQSAGLKPYYLYRQKNMVGMFENIGYSKPGHECLYNVGMMAEVQTILGIGAGAVSKFVDVANNKIHREFNVKNPEIYVERNQQP